MKTIFIPTSIVIVLITITSFGFAQLPANVCPSPGIACLNTPYNGKLDLANTNLYTIPATPLRLSYSKSPKNPNLGDVKYKHDDFYSALCPAPSDTDHCDNDSTSLIYDVYYPDTSYHNYATCALPAVILFHAGGFGECTNLALPNIVTVCRQLAMKGYVVFSVEYRTGRITDQTNLKLTSVQQQLAIYRALQDARGAIRSIIKRQLNEGTAGINDPYRININKIFVGGFSAGGLMAMNATWYTPAMVYNIFQNGGAGSATIQDALGDIDANFYYATKADLINAIGHDYQTNIIGNACMWGAVGIPTQYETLPLHEYDFFDSTLLKPLISFQGKKDPVFPYDLGKKQNINFSSSTSNIYNSTTYCINPINGAYFLDRSTSPAPDLISGSTLNMQNILLQYYIPVEHYVDPDMFHGFTTDTSGFFHGDFGTGVTNEQDACIYLAQRIATFSRQC